MPASAFGARSCGRMQTCCEPPILRELLGKGLSTKMREALRRWSPNRYFEQYLLPIDRWRYGMMGNWGNAQRRRPPFGSTQRQSKVFHECPALSLRRASCGQGHAHEVVPAEGAPQNCRAVDARACPDDGIAHRGREDRRRRRASNGCRRGGSGSGGSRRADVRTIGTARDRRCGARREARSR